MNVCKLISIVSAIWKRPELTEIFLDSLVRYRNDYGITAVVAGSERKSKSCLDRGIGYVEVKNRPLSGKFNAAALKAVRDFKPKALLILGSDDFIDDALINRYLKALKDGVDVAGITDCYFYDTISKQPMYWRGYTNFRKGETIGMARMLSKKVFNMLSGRLWPSNMDSGLDFTMMKKLKKLKGLVWQSFHIEGMIAVDIKGQGNISAFTDYMSNMTPVDISIFDTIPEFKQIREL